jgi:osmotically-inducible protein OsmY
MKADATLKREIEFELALALPRACNGVGVAVRRGVVTLSGHIDSHAQKLLIANAVDRVSGVRAIALELDVQQSPDHVRSDTDIARAAEQALERQVPDALDALLLIVDNGWVTLQGACASDERRALIERTVRELTGVVGVSNEIEPEPPVAARQAACDAIVARIP